MLQTRWVFLRLLGIVYLSAFLSLWVQIHGLCGSAGILPAGEFLDRVRDVLPSPERYYYYPTLCWLDASDRCLSGLCAGGTILSLLLIAGVAPVLVLVLLWAFYLSLSVAGQIFLAYQWDVLLLEAGFLAIFLAPGHLWPRLTSEAAPPRPVIWLFRWLVFRLVFTSGAVKLLSGDPSWRNLTALHFHYETQPLPTWASWYAFQLPDWFQRLSVVFTFAAELAAPVLIFGPRRFRYAACATIVGLQVLIAATGNYGFFNLLTIALCVLLLDDMAFPARWRLRTHNENHPSRRRGWPAWLIRPLAVVIFLLTLLPLVRFGPWPPPVSKFLSAVASLRSFNSYGLFAVMTVRRPEIIVEGSDDGESWTPYEFKWKPGDLNRPPPFAGLHMPRLDWQMWFAALDGSRREAWVVRFLDRLTQPSPDVLALIARNPFPARPPTYIRAVLYDYHFTDSPTRRESGAWWRRELLGIYCPMQKSRAPR